MAAPGNRNIVQIIVQPRQGRVKTPSPPATSCAPPNLKISRRRSKTDTSFRTKKVRESGLYIARSCFGDAARLDIPAAIP